MWPPNGSLDYLPLPTLGNLLSFMTQPNPQIIIHIRFSQALGMKRSFHFLMVLTGNHPFWKFLSIWLLQVGLSHSFKHLNHLNFKIHHGINPQNIDPPSHPLSDHLLHSALILPFQAYIFPFDIQFSTIISLDLFSQLYFIVFGFFCFALVSIFSPPLLLEREFFYSTPFPLIRFERI